MCSQQELYCPQGGENWFLASEINLSYYNILWLCNAQLHLTKSYSLIFNGGVRKIFELMCLKKSPRGRRWWKRGWETVQEDQFEERNDHVEPQEWENIEYLKYWNSWGIELRRNRGRESSKGRHLFKPQILKKIKSEKVFGFNWLNCLSKIGFCI